MKDNPVAKNAHKFNKASVHRDRKKAEKKGERKHKGKHEEVEEGSMKENGKGLWANIRAKRKRGEAPAKPGDKDYPKTLDVESVREGKELHIRMDNFNGPEEKKVLDILRNHEIKGNITYTGETDKGIIFDIKKPAMLNGINRELKKASSAGAVLEGKNTCVPKNEEVEQVDELSKKTMRSYVGKALDADKK